MDWLKQKNFQFTFLHYDSPLPVRTGIEGKGQKKILAKKSFSRTGLSWQENWPPPLSLVRGGCGVKQVLGGKFFLFLYWSEMARKLVKSLFKHYDPPFSKRAGGPNIPETVLNGEKIGQIIFFKDQRSIPPTFLGQFFFFFCCSIWDEQICTLV